MRGAGLGAVYLLMVAVVCSQAPCDNSGECPVPITDQNHRYPTGAADLVSMMHTQMVLGKDMEEKTMDTWEAEEEDEADEFDDSARWRTKSYRYAVEDYEVEEEVVAEAPDLSMSPSDRSLLSTRTSANCYSMLEDAANCGTSVVEDAARCGTKVVEDAVRCGTSTITSAVRCGESIFKSCKYSRRRSLGKLTCNFGKKAKSCKVAKKCNVAKSCPIANKCNVASSFSSCLNSVMNSVSGTGKEFLVIIKDSGCSSPDTCRDQIDSGLGGAWDLLLDKINDGLEDTVNNLASKVSDGMSAVKPLVEKAKSEGAAAVDEASQVAAQVGDYFKGVFGPFSKFEIGDVCTEQGSGFWWMEPTDCGAFDAMANIFVGFSNAASGFSSTVNKLGQCVRKTGLLNTPTPFFNLKVQRFCFPNFFVTPIEYFMGAVIYAAKAGKALAQGIETVITKVTTIANNIGLLELGRTVHDSRSNGNASFAKSGCGSQANWGVQIHADVEVSFNDELGNAASASFGFGVLTGCKDNMVLDPNWILNLGLKRGITAQLSEAKPPGAALVVGLTFSDTYPEFSNRATAAAGLSITPEVEIVDVAKVGLPIGFSILPASLPSGFTVSVEPAIGGLLEAKRDIEAAAEQAGKEATDRGSNRLGASFAEATRQLGKSDLLDRIASGISTEREALLQSALVTQSKGPALASEYLSKHFEMLRHSSKRSQGEVSALQEKSSIGSKRQNGIPVKVDAELGATITASFCITPGVCHGQ